MKNKIINIVKEYFKDEPLSDPYEITRACYKLQDLLDIDLFLLYRASETDNWLQAEYYSDKLKHFIILDYDSPSSYADPENLAEVLLSYIDKARQIESTI